ncbi:glycosyltransferase family 4 protein [Chloroflexota bacterium]
MQKKLRVLMVAACPFPYPRGTPIRIFRMAESLARRGHQIHVVTYHLGEQAEEIPYTIHRIPNIPFYQKLDPGPSFLKLFFIDFLLTIKLLNLIAVYDFDLIFAHHFEGFICALPVRLFRELPIIFDIHTLLETELPHYGLLIGNKVLRWIGRVFDTNLPGKADHIVGISEEIVNKMIQEAKVAPERVSLITNGVELELFMSAKPESEKKDKSKIVLAFAGNFARYQGIEVMLAALRIFKDSDPDISLNLISNNALDTYWGLIKELQIETNIKHISTPFLELPQQLANADILINPRFVGAGYPTKLLNYMAAGKPIVTFSGTSHKIIHGETGWIVQGSDPMDLAKGIQHLIDNPELREQLGVNARQYVKDNFMWKEKAKQIERICLELVPPSKVA